MSCRELLHGVPGSIRDSSSSNIQDPPSKVCNPSQWGTLGRGKKQARSKCWKEGPAFLPGWSRAGAVDFRSAGDNTGTGKVSPFPHTCSLPGSPVSPHWPGDSSYISTSFHLGLRGSDCPFSKSGVCLFTLHAKWGTYQIRTIAVFQHIGPFSPRYRSLCFF